MPMLKYGSASLIETNVNANDWANQVYTDACAGGKCRMKTARSIVAKYDPSKYLLSHCSIIAAVDVDEADKSASEYKDYLIKPEYSKWVNNNGDAWTKELLKEAYKTFIGCDNFLEHVQIKELSKGKVIDAALREISVGKDKSGKDLTTYYVDILVATDRKHEDLVRKIEAQELNTLSMGCGLVGTKIISSDGSFQNIEDVQKGDKVLTHTGASHRVTELFSMSVTGVPLVTVDAVGLYEPLRLTGEHPVLIATKESVSCKYSTRPCKIETFQSQCFYSKKIPWKCAGHKKPCGRNKDNYKYDVKFVPVSEIRPKDYLIKSFPVEEIDQENLSRDICYLIGAYAGDGYIVWQWKDKQKQYPDSVYFSVSLKETNLHNKLREVIRRVSPNATINEKDVPERNGKYIGILDKNLASLIYEHVGEGSHNKIFSEDVMFLPKEKQLSILSGYFDTDGCFYSGTYRVETASINLWNQTHLMLLRNKIPNAQERCWRKASGKKRGENYWQYSVHIGREYSSKISSLKQSKIIGVKYGNNLCFFYKNYYLIPVKNVKVSRFSGKVYNFSVEEDESYLINDIAVHNCVIAFSICTKCGNKAVDETEACEHVKYQKNNMFYDDSGAQRKIAELCGHPSQTDSVKFVDASWVKNPAFTGAVLRDVVDPPADIMAKLEKAHNVESYQVKDTDFLKAASHLIAQDEGDETPEEAPEGEDKAAPPEEEPAAEPAEEAPDVPEEGMPEEEPVEFGPDDVRKWKTKIKNQILEELGDEIAEEIGQKIEQRPEQLETLDESIIKPASVLKRVWGSKKVWDRFIKTTAGNLNKKDFNKLRYGAHMLITSNDPRILADYGYNKRDFLAVLSFVDKCLNKPLDVSVKKAVASIGGTQGKTPLELLEQVVSSTGRKITKKEAQRSLAWLRILDFYKG